MKGKGHGKSTGRAGDLEMSVCVYARSCSVDTMIGTILLPVETTLSKIKQASTSLVP